MGLEFGNRKTMGFGTKFLRSKFRRDHLETFFSPKKKKFSQNPEKKQQHARDLFVKNGTFSETNGMCLCAHHFLNPDESTVTVVTVVTVQLWDFLAKASNAARCTCRTRLRYTPEKSFQEIQLERYIRNSSDFCFFWGDEMKMSQLFWERFFGDNRKRKQYNIKTLFLV